MKPTRSKNIHQEIFLALPDYRENLINEFNLGDDILAAVLSTPVIGHNPALLNGGFETAGAGGADVFANWTEEKAGTTAITQDAVTFHSGAKAMKIVTDGAGNYGRVSHTALVYGQRYICKIWVKGGAASGTVAITNGTTVIYNTGALTTDWVQHEIDFIALFNILRIGSGTSSVSKTIYIDDIEVYKIATLADLKGGLGLNIANTIVREKEALSGKYALNMATGPNLIAQLASATYSIGLEARTYIFWVKPTAVPAVANKQLMAGGNFYFGIGGFGGHNTVYLYTMDTDEAYELEDNGSTDIITSDAWHMISIAFSIPDKVINCYHNGGDLVFTRALAADHSGFPTSSRLTLGGYSDAFDGYLRMYRNYNALLTSEQIKNIYFHTRRHVLGLPPRP